MDRIAIVTDQLVISYKLPAVFRYSNFAVGQKSESRPISRFLPNPLSPMQYRNEKVYTADSALYVHATCGAAAMLKWEFPETRIEPSCVDFHLVFRTSDVPQWWRNVTGGGAIRPGAILGLEPGR